MKTCVVSCAYELWALWVLIIRFGVTVFCGNDSQCREFYSCDDFFFIHCPGNLWIVEHVLTL